MQLDTDMTKQLLSSKSVMRNLLSADLPVYLHFGWHMTCEEINRIARLPLKVGIILLHIVVHSVAASLTQRQRLASCCMRCWGSSYPHLQRSMAPLYW